MRIGVLVTTAAAVALSAFGGSVLVIGLPAIAQEFRAPVASLSGLGTLLSLGAVGALPLAALADRAGRRRMLALAVAGFSAASLLSAWAPTLLALAAARLLGAGFEALAAGVATAYVVEETPARHRALAVSGLTLAAGVGIALSTVGFPLVAPHWRWLYAAAGCGLPLAGIVWWKLPESRAWHEPGASSVVVAALWEPPFRARLGVLAAYSALYAVFFEPAALFVVLFGSRLGLGAAERSAVVVVSGLAGAACFPLGGWIGDRFGRRLPGAALAAATAVAGGLTYGLATRSGYWAGSVAWSALASAGSPVLGAWFAELFPTRARATAEASFTFSGAVGAVAGLQAVAALEPRIGLEKALAACSLVALFAAALLLRLPETRDLPLPE